MQARRRFQFRDRLLKALYLNAAALLVLALALFFKPSGAINWPPSAIAQSQLPIGGGAGVFIVPAQFSASTFGAYLMDVDAQTLNAYQFFPAEHSFRLVAARSFKYDRKLGNYNTSPAPLEIKALVDKEQADVRALDQKHEPASPETPPKDQ